MSLALIDTTGTSDTLQAGLAKTNLAITALNDLGTPSAAGLTILQSASAAAQRVALSAASLAANTFVALQTITQAGANAGILASTGYSLTGASAVNMIDLAGTWNTSGNPTAFKLNITNTGSGASALLMDLQVGGSSKASISKAGLLSCQALTVSSNGAWSLHESVGLSTLASGAAIISPTWRSANRVISLSSNAGIAWISTTVDPQGGTADLFLGRGAAASLVMGLASATPMAQTLGASGSRSGTDANTAGTSLTIAAGAGTGTAAVTGAVLNLQAPVAVGSGTNAQTLTTGWQIINGVAKATVYTVATLPSASTCGAYCIAAVSDASDAAGTNLGTAPTGGGAVKRMVYSDGTNWLLL